MLPLMLALTLSAAEPPLSKTGPKTDGLTPFGGKPQAIPGTIEFENFDEGGEGIAYHDIDADNDAPPIAYRKTTVDLEIHKKVILIGHMKTGEWMKYTVDVAKSGAYEVFLGASVTHHVDGADSPEIRIEFDGVDMTGPFRLPSTDGGWY
ncbi:MAG: hypothetical protein ACREH8_17980, partial [Opitutaceae bacterium]